jgi:hypothetical protein
LIYAYRGLSKAGHTLNRFAMKMVGARGASKRQLKASGARFHSASSFRYVKHLRAEF